MKQISWLISKYLVGAILPYFAFSWLLLSVILFVQQASRFSDIFFSVNIPANLIWQLTIALIPNVIAFTCPMAMLVGTVIGLSKMQGDSELVAIRAAGVGNMQIAIPIIVLGVLLSIFAFVVNLKGVPLAAAIVRSVALQTAIKKLESPIEPGVFNTEVAGYTIYVKGGDIGSGRWNNIFIYNEDRANNSTRLITSRSGRIDVTDQLSELVLENATVSTIPNSPGAGKYVAENIGEVRLAIKTRRGELIDKLSNSSGTPEELGLSQLSDYANAADGKNRTEAQILWQRRITLSITPLIFCLLGTAMILRFDRGGRGFGIFLALIGLIGYYLLAFAGEQLARTGKLSVFAGGFLPIAASFVAIGWFTYSRRINFWSDAGKRFNMSIVGKSQAPTNNTQTRNLLVDLTTGLRDLDLVLNLFKYFLLTFGFLTAIFLIFTAFELWKFAGTIDGGLWLLVRYLFYLMPFIYLQIAPSAAMVATLATYVIKSRQNEIVTWTSAGQSVYRLLVPCFALMALLGAVNWLVQERVTPRANQLQDEIRTQIRRGGAVSTGLGKYWVATDKHIYSFELGDSPSVGAGLFTTASDNVLAIGVCDRVADRSRSCFADSKMTTASDNEVRERIVIPLEREVAGVEIVNAIAVGDRGAGRYIASFAESTMTAASDNEVRERIVIPLEREVAGVEIVNAIAVGDRVADRYLSNFAESTITVASDNEMRDEVVPFEREVAETATTTVTTAGSVATTATSTASNRHKEFEFPKNAGLSFPLLLFFPPQTLPAASDNEKRGADCPPGCVKNLVVYEFSIDGSKLQSVYRAPSAIWERGKVLMIGNIEKSMLAEGKITTELVDGSELVEESNPFAGVRGKPSHLKISELKTRLAETDSEVERNSFGVAIEKRYSTLILPLIIGLFTAPFALSLSRKGKVVTVGYAIGLWLLFMGITNTFAQFGESGSLSAGIAVWSPLMIFAMLGVYLLSRVRT